MPAQPSQSNRQRAWIALSQLFIDSELDDAAVRDIAQQLISADCSAEEAETILWNEVAPALGSNLASVAGNWTGWSDEDVIALVSARLQKDGEASPPGMLSAGWLQHRWVKRVVLPDWLRVAALLREQGPSRQ